MSIFGEKFDEEVRTLEFAGNVVRAFYRHLMNRGSKNSWRFPPPSLENVRRYRALDRKYTARRPPLFEHDLIKVYGEEVLK